MLYIEPIRHFFDNRLGLSEWLHTQQQSYRQILRADKQQQDQHAR